ncbi:VOC family protein [Pandoraea sp. NPDC087047]|uniref:VOC family protein n=1 Tax=Pandoraea sp. NPDC087047 TaxID=3364390 RepID=UPI003827ED43
MLDSTHAVEATASGTPVTPVAIDHVAYPSYDATLTHRFYVDVMGFTLAGAQAGMSRLWGKPYLLVSYQIAPGEALAFFNCDGLAPEPHPHPDTPATQIHHLALRVRDREALDRWKTRLGAHDVRFAIERHGDGEHLYLLDPNDIMLELCVQTPESAAGQSQGALDTLQRWIDGVR